MEAGWLFGVSLDQIQVVIQPASVIHSMIEYEDGAVLAQLGTPDMKLPIQYALYYPERRFLPGDRLDFTKLREITFDVPDPETFNCLLYTSILFVSDSAPFIFYHFSLGIYIIPAGFFLGSIFSQLDPGVFYHNTIAIYIISIIDPLAVSYTHLDVYKRQDQCSGSACQYCQTGTYVCMAVRE